MVTVVGVIYWNEGIDFDLKLDGHQNKRYNCPAHLKCMNI